MKRMSFASSFVSSPASAPLCSIDGPVRHVERDAHLVREDLRERRLAEARRTAEEHVIERLAALLRGLHEDAQVLLVLRLADVVVERARTERAIEAHVVTESARVDAALFAVIVAILRSRLRHRVRTLPIQQPRCTQARI